MAQSPYPLKERLIIALDVDDPQSALRLVNELGEHVCFYKIGYQLFYTKGSYELIERLRQKGKKIFLDLKLHDVPRTVFSAIKSLNDIQPDFLTLHSEKNLIKAAIDALDVCANKKTKLLAVTVLTSIDAGDLKASGITLSLTELVKMRAIEAESLGCAGVVASALEAKLLRQVLKPSSLIVTPAIRLSEPALKHEPLKSGSAFKKDDQKRVLTPQTAIRNGADYLVIGRPVTHATQPLKTVLAIQSMIKQAIDINTTNQ
ncbi:MAG: orotidine-5'-phosphate decarboxylase [Pseudomonadota bacterium]